VSLQKSCWQPLLWDMEHVKLYSIQTAPISETALGFEGSQDLSVNRRFSKILKKTISLVMSVDCLSVHPSAWKNSTPTGLIFMKFDIWVFFENLSRNFKLNLHRRRITVVYMKSNVFLIIPRSVLPRMRNISGKRFREHQDEHFTFNIFFFVYRTVFEVR
jgi:hypothetical protein